MIFASLLPTLCGLEPMVLCFGTDGHVALETPALTCQPPAPSPTEGDACCDRLAAPSCGDCSDVKLPSSGVVPVRHGPSESLARLALLAQLPLASFILPCREPDPGTPAFVSLASSERHPPPSWSGARTTVLLI